jgi:hypothetical protein
MEQLEEQMRAHFGGHWYMRGASEQQLKQYVEAKTDADRDRATRNMKRTALNDAMQVLRAGICAGLVERADGVEQLKGN